MKSSPTKILPIKQFININLIYKEQTLEFNVSNRLTFKEFKLMLQENLQFPLEICYLFYKHIHLIADSYDHQYLSQLLISNNEKYQESYIMYLLTQEEYDEISEKLNYIFCHEHIMNKAHLFCKNCEQLICDICAMEKHKSHKNIFDQAVALDAYFNKVNGLCNKFSERITLNEGKLNEVIDEMNDNLDIFLKEEKLKIMKYGENLKAIMDEICNIECSRIENLVNKAKEKLEFLNTEGTKLLELSSRINEFKDLFKIQLEEFKSMKLKNKTDMMIDVNKQLTQLIFNEKNIERIIQKINFSSDGDDILNFQYSTLLEQNRDNTFKVTVKNINQLLKMSLKQLITKAEEENYEEIINIIEDKHFNKINSSVYNKELDLSILGHNKLYQVIDDTDELLCLKIDNFKITRLKTQFKQKVKKISTGRKSSLNKPLQGGGGTVNSGNTENLGKRNTGVLNKKTSTNFAKNSINADTTANSKKNEELDEVNKKDNDNHDMLLEEQILTKFPKYCRNITIAKKIYVVGGEDDSGTINYFLEVDPENEFFVKALKPMTSNRAGPNLININNKFLYAISGAYHERSSEFYDFENTKWVRLNTVVQPRVGAILTLVNNSDLYMFFGKNWNKIQRKWEFVSVIERIKVNFESYKWEEVEFKYENNQVQVQRAFSGCITNFDNSVLVVGGQIPIGEPEEKKTEATNSSIKIDFEKMKITEDAFELPLPYSFLNPSFYVNNLVNINFDVEGNAHYYTYVHKNHWIIDY